MEYRELNLLEIHFKEYLKESGEQNEPRTQFLWLDDNHLLNEEKVKEYNAKNFLQGTR